MPAEDEEQERNAGLRPALAGFLGVFIASLCCLPLVAVALGTVGGLGLIIGLATYRVPLTLLGIGLFIVGVYQYRRTKARRCET